MDNSEDEVVEENCEESIASVDFSSEGSLADKSYTPSSSERANDSIGDIVDYSAISSDDEGERNIRDSDHEISSSESDPNACVDVKRSPNAFNVCSH